MKWSWKVGQFRGIAVYMHATFLILIGFIVLSHWSAGSSLAKTMEGVGFILALFGCVVLHEFGQCHRRVYCAGTLRRSLLAPSSIDDGLRAMKT
jgi:Zn-dependent protease